MLAHKVAQYHGLHTSTVDYENGVARVVAHRRSVQDKVYLLFLWLLVLHDIHSKVAV